MGVSYICPPWIYVENYMLTATLLFNYDGSYNETEPIRSTPLFFLSEIYTPIIITAILEKTMIRRTLFF